MVLTLVMYRASLEQFAGQAEYEALARQLPDWIDRLKLSSEIEKDEDSLLRAALGKADEKVIRNSGWRTEGLAVLAWALKRFDIPSHEELTDPRKAAASVGFSEEMLAAMDTAAASKIIESAELRPAEEIDRYATRATLITWRLRSYRIHPDEKQMDFVGYLKAHPSFKPAWLEGLPLANNDLAIGKTAFGDAAEEKIVRCEDVAEERQIAAYWLQGNARLYSKVDPSTILFGLP
jgi:hypothetical protein